jgi:hypothetical protein
MKLSLLLVCVLIGIASAQGPTVGGLPPGTLTIDGAVNPNAIADADALRMFYAFAHPQNGKIVGDQTSKSLEVFLRKLAPLDVALLRQHVATWNTKYGPQLVGSTPTGPVATYEQVSAASKAELLLLQSTLSTFGWSTLADELKRLKGTMKVYQVPASATNH